MYGTIKIFASFILVLFLLVLIPSELFAEQRYCFDFIFECLDPETLELDTLRKIASVTSKETPLGLLLAAVFENDGEKARAYYERILTLFSGDSLEAIALERLYLYHYTNGDKATATTFLRFLKQRHPDFAMNRWHPELDKDDGLNELMKESRYFGKEVDESKTIIPSERAINWTVQVGAFSEHSRAIALAQQLAAFGSVHLVRRDTDAGTFTAVQVGRYATRLEAERMQVNIENSTRISGRVISIEYK